ncbi:hypothetical protein MN116_002138 [Schistosoma mekongi]|uniref:Uncharacterized protein n=1 Tax=Schistosoma mekongi TaxID=38744 RepID=A0AAE2D845_SCHME|nr:hypothetical protein MN116_002138 [Schistosoma mekongi]
MNKFSINDKFKPTLSNSITLTIPQSHSIECNESNLIQLKQIKSTIHNVYSSKSIQENKIYKQRLLSNRSIKSDKTCIQMPIASFSMLGKLELTSFNQQATTINEMHSQKRYSDAFLSSFAIRQSNPSRKNVYYEHQSNNIHCRHVPTSHRRSQMITSHSSMNLKSKNYELKHFSSSNITIIDLANTAQYLIINALKSPLHRSN